MILFSDEPDISEEGSDEDSSEESSEEDSSEESSEEESKEKGIRINHCNSTVKGIKTLIFQ